MLRILPPAVHYLVPVFVLAFGLGVLRTLWIAPRSGEVAAALIEVPVVLAFAWVVAGRVLRRWPLAAPADRAAMGALAFAMLMGLDLALGSLVFGRRMPEILAAMATPAGGIGLAGQIAFGALPLLHGRG